MDEIQKNRIALFRYGIIAPLVTRGEVTPHERWDFFRTASQKQYLYLDERMVHISEDTIYRYYRNYLKSGFDGLKPAGRSDIGKTRKLDDDICSQIRYLVREYPRLPCTLIYQRLVDNGTITRESVSLSTITRYVNTLKSEQQAPGVEMLRYEVPHINQVWYGDSSVGPYLRNGNKRTKTWIIALIDDASRMVVGIDIFENDNYVNLLSVIRSAVIRYGRPQTMKFDNGANYRSHQMELLGARMGTAISYAPPRRPVGKAKIERWFRTLKDSWMAGLNMNDFKNIEQLRDSLSTYVQKYNQSPHGSLGKKTPQDRFYEESSLIFRFDDDRIKRTFLLEDERTVTADNVITIDKKEYEVDYKYSGKRLLIRYSPDLKTIYSVDRKTGEMEEIHLLDKKKNSSGHRKTFRFSEGGKD